MRKPKTKTAPEGSRVDHAGGPESIPKKAFSESSTDLEILKNKSTATKVQLAKVLALLRQGPKTTIELRQQAIMMPAARVFQLKRLHNFTITTELVALYDAEGVRHQNCARYHLVEGARNEGGEGVITKSCEV